MANTCHHRGITQTTRPQYWEVEKTGSENLVPAGQSWRWDVSKECQEVGLLRKKRIESEKLCGDAMRTDTDWRTRKVHSTPKINHCRGRKRDYSIVSGEGSVLKLKLNKIAWIRVLGEKVNERKNEQWGWLLVRNSTHLSREPIGRSSAKRTKPEIQTPKAGNEMHSNELQHP